MFNQTELVEFINDMPEFKHLMWGVMDFYCKNYGKDAYTYQNPDNHYEVDTFFNPKYCVEWLYMMHGMTCRVCGNVHGGSEGITDIESPFELWKVFMPEFPKSSHDHSRLDAPPLCPECLSDYVRFRSRKTYRDYDHNKRRIIPADFLVYRVNKEIRLQRRLE